MTPVFVSRQSRLVHALLGALSLLLLWQVLPFVVTIPTYIVPRPVSVLTVFLAQKSLLIHNFLPTGLEAVLGFLFGNLAGVAVATLFVHFRRIELAYFPVTLFFNTIPIIALTPVIIVAFGIGLLPKVVIASIVCFFPTLVNMTRGLQAASLNEFELMHVLSASRWQVFWRLRFPRSLPFLFASLRIAATTSVVGAIVGEWIGANSGLGAMILQATFSYRADQLYAAIILSSLLAVAMFTLVSAVETRVMAHR